jgi:tetratricopeptide (TPR) repeat protein
MARCSICARRLLVDGVCPDDGGSVSAASESPPPLTPPAVTVPGWALGAPLGRGGFAEVWAATAADGRAGALKLGLGATASLAARFEREASLLAIIGGGATPALLDRGVLADGRPFFVMERLTGETLAGRLGRARAPLDLAQAAALGDGIVAALGRLHGGAVVHRDLKPENVFLGEDGRVTLIDLGLATGQGARVFGSLTQIGEIAGTPEYMAPEQHSGRGEIDARTDLYALGVLLYELVTLRVPFAGAPGIVTHGHLRLRPPRPRLFAPLPPPLEDVILSCLAKRPSERPQSLGVLAERLGRAWRSQAPATRIEARSVVADAAPYPDAGAKPAPTAANAAPPERRPVVLLALHSAAPLAQIAPIIEVAGGVMARRAPGLVVAAFPGGEVGDPVDHALGAAARFAELDLGPTCAHVSELRVRRHAGATQFFGPELERARAWMPQAPWSGGVVTAALAETVSRPLVEVAGLGGFYREVAGDGGNEGLVGRAAELGLAHGVVAEARRVGGAALITIVAEPGLGKSAFLDALVARVAADEENTLVIRLDARRAGGDPGALRARLGAGLGQTHAGLELTGQSTAPELARALVDAARRVPLVVAVDDAHACDDALLDGLALATLDGVDAPLVVLVAATPELERAHLDFGRRARHHTRVALGALAVDDALTLAARLLQPAEYPARELLARLVAWTGGVPALLRDLARSLRRGGFVRRDPVTGTWRLQPAALDALPASTSGRWLAARELGRLLPELALFLELAATLGARFRVDELAAVIERAELAGELIAPLTVDAGLTDLEQLELVNRPGSGEVSFTDAGFGAAVAEAAPVALRRVVHVHALAHHQAGLGRRALEGVARHAQALGAGPIALAAHAELARQARRGHRYADADQRLSAALALASDDASKVDLLLARGAIRYRIQRCAEAVTDLRTARELVRAAGSAPSPRIVEILLEEATAHDWAADYEASKQAHLAAEAEALALAAAAEAQAPAAAAEAQAPAAAAEAQALAALPPGLAARLMIGRGRVAWRDGRVADSLELLAAAITACLAASDDEGVTVGRMMQAPALALMGRTDESRTCFDALIATCRQRGDRLHLSAAYGNRLFLWSALQDVPAAMADVEHSMLLAREIGNANLERPATYNLAEMLFHLGKSAEALDLAERSVRLRDKFVDETRPEDDLLVIKILTDLGRRDEARARLARLAARGGPDASAPGSQVFFRLLTKELVGSDESWDEILATGRAQLTPEELLEAHFWRARAVAAAGAADRLPPGPEVAELLAQAPILRGRFARLGHAD